MSNNIQLDYETRVSRFRNVIHGTDGLASLVTVYYSLLKQYRQKGRRLWEIEPLLFIFIKSLETNLHISLARILEPRDRSHGNLEKFLGFCKANAGKIRWADGQLTSTLIDEQKAELERHRKTIENVKSRRDRRFAHSDRMYFGDEDRVLEDFPVTEEDIVDLANCVIRLFGVHHNGLKPNLTILAPHIFNHIMVDNMIRNLEAGRKRNLAKRRREKRRREN
jgi:hypothetical protein